jgi:hypothetical protein
MKTIAIEQVDERLTVALEQQRREEPIVLTKGSDAIGLLLKLPEGTKDSDVDGAVWVEDPVGGVMVLILAKHGAVPAPVGGPGLPVFGSCRGMLTIISEDDEYLKDFEEYM